MFGFVENYSYNFIVFNQKSVLIKTSFLLHAWQLVYTSQVIAHTV